MNTEVEARLRRSEKVLVWVANSLDGLKAPKLSSDKRTRLAAACLHVAIEHAQAIVVLAHEGLYGSMMALIRVLFEAYVRGVWLMVAASSEDIDRAGRDRFTKDIGTMIADIDKYQDAQASVASLKDEWWKRLCSFTHTGYQQIGARLTPDGLGHNYETSEIVGALAWADTFALICVGNFAALAENKQLAEATLAEVFKLRGFEAEVVPPTSPKLR
jgi:hypothetical protein